MSKSKSDILHIVLAILTLAGCDAMRVPEPGPSSSPLRAAMTSVVVSGSSYSVGFSRPVTEDGESYSTIPWFDDQKSGFAIVSSSRFFQVFGGNAILNNSGLTAYSSYDTWPDSGDFRLRGVLKWNASAPFTLSAGNTVVDSFDLVPEKGERIVFQRGLVRADIGMRWPRLARARNESLTVWSKLTDSVSAFLRDWKDLCLARGAVDERILSYNRQTTPPSFQWRLPDSGDMRRIMDGTDPAQTTFVVGDSIWTQNRRAWSIYLGLASKPSNGAWGTMSDVYDSIDAPFIRESFSTSALSMDATGTVVRFYDYYSAYGDTTSRPSRIRFQVTGICPTIIEWWRHGATDRNHRPRGNVAPFDGYFCRILPDTVSFPRGDIVVVPVDTATRSKSKLVVPSIDTTKIVTKALP